MDGVAVDYSGVVARVAIGPRWSAADASALRTLWAELGHDPNVEAVVVLASSAGQECETQTEAEEAIGPKRNGLLKPFGIGVRGVVRNEMLQLVGEADVVVATRDASFADTSASEGRLPVHAFALRDILPELEELRLGLLGAAAPMSSERALQLGLVSTLVSDDELEAEVRRRVDVWLRH